MSNNKSSSIDFFWNQIPEILPFTVDTETAVKLLEAFEQAKAMHEEEMKNFTEDWYHNGPLLGVDVLVSTSIEKHYNETFGND